MLAVKEIGHDLQPLRRSVFCRYRHLSRKSQNKVTSPMPEGPREYYGVIQRGCLTQNGEKDWIVCEDFLELCKGKRVRETKGINNPELWKHTRLRTGTWLQYTGGQELVIKDCVCHYQDSTPNPIRPRSRFYFKHLGSKWKLYWKEIKL